tara:strand:+ start:457 stop:639 length:183 start_codon:yes stop_codon:yes gene_type:complete
MRFCRKQVERAEFFAEYTHKALKDIERYQEESYAARRELEVANSEIRKLHILIGKKTAAE